MTEFNVSSSVSPEDSEERSRANSSVERPKEQRKQRRRLREEPGLTITVEVGDARIRELGDDQGPLVNRTRSVGRRAGGAADFV
jgi:hypothetical protein